MGITGLYKKLKMLHSQLNPESIQALEQVFMETQNSGTDGERTARAADEALFTDILYALMRHQEWQNVEIFQAILVDFLQDQHRLPRTVAAALIRRMQTHLGSILPPQALTFHMDDQDFLTALFVSAASSTSEQDLVDDLGLGRRVIELMRRATAISQVGPAEAESAEPAYYVSPVDATLTTLLLELAVHLQSKPWALDLYRLKFLLLPFTGAASIGWSDDALESILIFLTQAAMDKTISADIIAEDTFAALGAAFRKSETLLNLLVDADLLFKAPQAARKKNQQRTLYAPTTKAVELSAALFLAKIWSGQAASISEFAACPNPYQVQIIKNAPASFVGAVLDTPNIGLSPQVLQAAIQRLIGENSAIVTPAWTAAQLEKFSSSWHRASIIQGLGTHASTINAIADVLKNVANSDPSPTIKSAVAKATQSTT